MKVPFFRYEDTFKKYKKNIMIEVERIIDSGKFILQNDVQEAEDIISKLCNNYDVVSVGNATDGLEILIESLGLENGSEVIVSMHTMSATVSAIRRNGLVPVVASINNDLMLSLEGVKYARTNRTTAVCITQLNGFVNPESNEIKKYCDTENLILFEDLAQSMSAKFNGEMAGGFGKGGAISFYPAKVFGCMGDGGAIVTKEAKLFENMLSMRDHGRGKIGDPKKVCGRNSRMDNLQCAVIKLVLNDYIFIVERRKQIFDIYISMLSKIPSITIPSVYAAKESFGIYQNFEIIVEKRELLINFLKENNIGSLVQWGGVAASDYNYCVDKSNQNSKQIFAQLLILPCYPSMSDEEVAYVAEKVIEFYND